MHEKTFRLKHFRTPLEDNLTSCPGLDSKLNFYNIVQTLLTISISSITKRLNK